MISVAEKKIVSISPKHQITIPQIFYNLFNFNTEAEFSVQNGNLVLKPVKNKESEDEFLSGLNDGISGHPVIGLAEGKFPALKDINLLDDEIAGEFGDYV